MSSVKSFLSKYAKFKLLTIEIFYYAVDWQTRKLPVALLHNVHVLFSESALKAEKNDEDLDLGADGEHAHARAHSRTISAESVAQPQAVGLRKDVSDAMAMY